MTTTTTTSDASNSDGETSEKNQAISEPPCLSTTPIVPSLPPTSASRGDVVDQKEKPAEIINGGGCDDVTALPETPPKLYLSSHPNEARRPIPSSGFLSESDHASTHQNLMETTPRTTIASAILGRQQKLDNLATTDVRNTLENSFKTSNRSPNTGAFAIPGPQAENVAASPSLALAETNDPSNNDDDSNIIHAEIAPDVEEIVHERLQAIQQERDNEIADEENDNQNDNNNNNKDGSSRLVRWTNRNNLVVVIALICFTILVAGITSAIVAPSSATNTTIAISSEPTATPSVAPSTAMPTTIRHSLIIPSLLGQDNFFMKLRNSNPEAIQWLLDSDI